MLLRLYWIEMAVFPSSQSLNHNMSSQELNYNHAHTFKEVAHV